MAALNIERIREKKMLVQSKRAVVASRIKEVEELLQELFSDMEIYASGRDITLDQNGPDDFVYGHFSFDQNGLSIAFRDTGEDFYDGFNGVPDEERSYKIIHYSLCRTSWLEQLSSKKAIESLLAALEAKLDEFNSAADESIDAFAAILEHQNTELNIDASSAVKLTGVETLFRDWVRARRLILIEPADSITRSSSYLESVCKYILHDMGLPLPDKDNISNLVKACVQHMPLSVDAGAQELLAQMLGSFRGVFQSVGAIRTQFGSAHGASPGDFEMGEHEARFVNNAAATVSMFLLNRYSAFRQA